MIGARSKSKLVEVLARLGYGARGLVSILVGGLAVLAALGSGEQATGSRGALRTILEQPLGWVWLGLIGLGLACFALWRAVEAVTDADRRGTSWKAIGVRCAHLGSSIIHAGLAAFAISLALGWSASGKDRTRSVQDWTAWLMAHPFGPWLVIGVGAAIAAGGLGFLWKGWRGETVAEFLVCDETVRRWAVPLGRLGLSARGVVFVLIGLFLILAGWHGQSSEARGLGGALASLERQPYGWVLLAGTALGLAAFGAFGLVQSRYRRIEPPQLKDAGDAIARGLPGSGEA